MESQCLWVHWRAKFLQSIIKALQEYQLSLTVSNQLLSNSALISWWIADSSICKSHLSHSSIKNWILVVIATVVICDHDETFQKKSPQWRYQSREQEPEPMDHLCHPATMQVYLVYVRTDTTRKTTCLHYLSLWSFQNTASQSLFSRENNPEKKAEWVLSRFDSYENQCPNRLNSLSQ